MTVPPCKPGGCSSFGCEGGRYCYDANGQPIEPTPDQRNNLQEVLDKYTPDHPLVRIDDPEDIDYAELYRWMRTGKPLFVKVPLDNGKFVEYYLGHKPEKRFGECLDKAICEAIAKEQSYE